MLGPVSEWVVNYVKDQLKEHGVLTWFDPDASFKTLVDLIDLPNCTVVPFRGSYYDQRYRAEEAFDALTPATLAKGHTLLLYVPRNAAEATPLLEFTKAGVKLELTLNVAASKALQGRLPRAVLDELLTKRRPTLSDLDQLGSADRPNVLKAIFNTSSETEIVVSYLTKADFEEELDEREAYPEFVSFCQAVFGLSSAPSTHLELKPQLVRHLLLSEFRENLQPQPVALLNTPPPSAEQTAHAKAVLRSLREQEGTRETYRAMASAVQAETGVESWGVVPSHLASLDTFPFIEPAALREVESLVGTAGDLLAASQLVNRGLSSFWVAFDGGRLQQWLAASLCITLAIQADRVQAAVKQLSTVSPAQAVIAYVHEQSGWWQMDQAHRRLEAHVAEMVPEFELEPLLEVARHQYSEASLAVAERFDAALADKGFHFSGHLQQVDVFSRFVEPVLATGEPVAYFLVDSLRFEMGRELFDTVTSVDKELHSAIGTPPTITQIGMAALMPRAEKGVSLVTDGTRLGLAVDGTEMYGSADRSKWIKSKAGGWWVEDLSLDRLVSDSESKLKKLLDKKSFVVVRSQEIDAHGEEDNRNEARQAMSRVLKSLRKAIERLRKVGFTRIVIAADHGHLFAQEYGDDQKVPAPNGQKVELHRRCWIGQNASPPPQALHFRAAELGLGGDLELVVPKRLAIFKAQGGGEAYFHGGLSLQELVIPVLVLKLAPPTKAASKVQQQFQVKPSRPTATNRMFMVELNYSSITEPDKRVRVVALKDGQEVGRAQGAQFGFDDRTMEVSVVSAKPNNVFISLTGELEGQGDLTLQVVDPKTSLVLAQTHVPYELM